MFINNPTHLLLYPFLTLPHLVRRLRGEKKQPTAIASAPKGTSATDLVEEAPVFEEISENVGLDITATRDSDKDIRVRVSVQPGPGRARVPVDIVCVVDISYSMSTLASITTNTGKQSHGLTMLDVVKHAVKTVIHSLQPMDRIAVVAFESDARICFPLTEVYKTPRNGMITKLERLVPGGSTDIWAGMEKAMELLRNRTQPNKRYSSILLLTDGVPNCSPMETLQQYREKYHQIPNINTFGFGYSLDTQMLLDIAKEGHGMYSFIPDASFVGTAFINALSNLMVTMATKVKLILEPQNNARIKKVVGSYSQENEQVVLMDLCSLQYGQSKDVIVKMECPPNLDGKPFIQATLQYEPAIQPNQPTELVPITLHSLSPDDVNYSVLNQNQNHRQVSGSCSRVDTGGIELEVEHVRIAIVYYLFAIIRLMTSGEEAKAQDKAQKILDRANKIDHPDAIAMVHDLIGQVREAMQPDYFAKWGKHYLPSLACSHHLQQCNNFKDPGIQRYGGTLFHQIRDAVENIFVKLPAPRPARLHNEDSSFTSAKSKFTSLPLESMSVYYNASGACIAGQCLVRMADGSKKRVDQVTKGDKVASSLSYLTSSVVVCVVATHCEKGCEWLSTLPGGLKLTPYHPVRVKGDVNWQFPNSIAAPTQDEKCDTVFNFLLEGKNHSMVIEGVECVTLGHGLTDDVVCHPYFGTQKVVHDLSKMEGYSVGLIHLKKESVVRDAKTGMVAGFCGEICEGQQLRYTSRRP